MALQTELVDVADLQHVRIRSSVNHVACLAPIHLHGRMFINEWPLLVRMAFEADIILSRRRSKLMGFHGAVWIVAVAALHQPFVHSMVERHVEFSLLREVA